MRLRSEPFAIRSRISRCSSPRCWSTIIFQSERIAVRALLALFIAAFTLAGCGGSGPAFKNTDITGADYGRDFALTDHTGKRHTLADFRGKVVVMFFGYTRDRKSTRLNSSHPSISY